MDRRLFLRNAGLIAAGFVAADQLELLDKLTKGRSMLGWTSDYSELRAGAQLWAGDLVYQNGEFAYPIPANMQLDQVGPISRANFRKIMDTIFNTDSLFLPPLENPQLLEGPLPVHNDGDLTPKLLVVSR